MMAVFYGTVRELQERLLKGNIWGKNIFIWAKRVGKCLFFVVFLHKYFKRVVVAHSVGGLG